MRIFLLLLFFTLPSLALIACSCYHEEINEETFDRYPFVAHVRVDKVEELNGPFESRSLAWLNDVRLVHFSVLDLYRGELSAFAIESDHGSSCGTYIEEDQELLVYGILDRAGQINIASCTPNELYRDANGVKELSYGYPTRLKSWLDAYCGVLPDGVTTVGASQYIHRYPNGQLEEQTEYKDGLRHGNSVHHYPNGVLMDEQHYYKGRPTGLRHYYLKDGTLDFELEHDFRGELVRETNYHEGYDDLRHEILYIPGTNLEKDFGFRADGTLAKMIMRRDWNNLAEKYYDAGGKLIHYLAYYEDGIATVLLDSLAPKR